ncbi:MAG: winged helix-turn-helix transcriptional regulator [Thermoplasmatota archaeon]
MATPAAPDCCPFSDAMTLLGRRYALPIIWALRQESPRRFNDIKKQLGVNPVTLSQRLSELDEAGIVSRTAYQETPPRVDYALTESGLALFPVLSALEDWVCSYQTVCPEGKTRFAHAANGQVAPQTA